MEQTEESHLLRHQPCSDCGSSDACALYSDGHTFCFSCNAYTHGGDDVEVSHAPSSEVFSPIRGESTALPKRKLSQETTTKWGYEIGTFQGRPVQVANYRDASGNIVGQKLRFPDKSFVFRGNSKKAGLYGQHLWRDGGKMLTIVEGEVDALSLSQAFQNKWPVVSIRTGAKGAKRDITAEISWIEKFETVVFMFDSDEPGRQAAEECALLLTPGKAKIAKLPLKDANEMLVAGRVAELIDAVWGAKVHRPDGILSGNELWERFSNREHVESLTYPYRGMTEVTRGIRKGEIVTITAGSGIGKSQLTREIAFHLFNQGQTVGYIALEESVERSMDGFVGLYLNKPIHLDRDIATPQELKDGFNSTIGSGRMYFYDHWGSTDSDNLLAKIRYLVRGCGCSHIVLDHLSIVVSGMGDGDERRLIDNTMTKLRALTEELKCGMLLVSHLKRPEGRGHEEGATTTLAQLRGSAAIAQLSDIVMGLERNQQDPENQNLTTVRILKNRFSGVTGVACSLLYDRDTGRMSEAFSSTEGGNVIEEMF